MAIHVDFGRTTGRDDEVLVDPDRARAANALEYGRPVTLTDGDVAVLATLRDDPQVGLVAICHMATMRDIGSPVTPAPDPTADPRLSPDVRWTEVGGEPMRSPLPRGDRDDPRLYPPDAARGSA